MLVCVARWDYEPHNCAAPYMEDTDVAPKDFGEKDTRKSSSKLAQVASGRDAAFRGYINLDLNKDEKAAYVKWAAPETVFAVFALVLEDGVNVAVKPDPKQDGFLASATQRRESSVNAGLCVTARAGDAVTAFGRLMYLLSILARAESWEATQPMANPDRW